MTRIALAGSGWVSSLHALAIDAAGADVVAFASRNRERADAQAEQYGGRAVGLEDLPAGADIVVVATPPAQHARHALQAAAGGVAVLVEKPLCTTLGDADRLVRVADAGAMITYAENLLFAHAANRAFGEIAGLGELSELRARIRQPPPSWGNFLAREAGGGVALDLGVHALALVVRAAGTAQPVSVNATFDATPEMVVEDVAQITVGFDNGLRADVELSWRTDTPEWDLQAASSTGVVRLEFMPNFGLERNGEPVDLGPVGGGLSPATGGPGSDVPPELHQLGYVNQIREVVYASRGNRGAARSDARFGRLMLEIVCAAAASARAGFDVALPFTGPRELAPIEIWRPEAL